jgi:hypothetical protein
MARSHELFKPDLNGPPRPPRRRVRPQASTDFPFSDLRPTQLPSGALTAAALQKAFGPSPLICNPMPSCVADEPAAEIAPEELEWLKRLNISDLLRHFSGEEVRSTAMNATHPSPDSAETGSVTAGYHDKLHWPAL